MKRARIKIEKEKIATSRLVGIFVILGLVFFAVKLPLALSENHSPEVGFTDSSKESGLQIVPASCASSPSYYHAALPVSSDGHGYYTASGETEYGAYDSVAAEYICVSNSSGNTYFIPGNNATELNSFKTYPPAGVSAY